MKSAARQALTTIQQCVRADRFGLTFHFRRRMRERGLFWGDVLHALNNAGEVRKAGLDVHGLPKWIIQGTAADDQMIEIVCTIEEDESGIQFITLYWE